MKMAQKDWKMLALEVGGMRSQAQEGLQPAEAGRDKAQLLPREPPRRIGALLTPGFQPS